MAPPKKTSRAGDSIDAGIPAPAGVEDLFKTPEERVAWDDKLALSGEQEKAAARKSEIDALLKQYEAAKESERRARIGTGIAARTMAISNPNAAKAILETRTPLDTMETTKIGDRLALEKSRLGNDSDMQKVTYEDQMRDPNSAVSAEFRNQLKKNGITVDDNATAKDILTVFPFLKADIQADTQRRGQDFTYETNEKNRASREGIAGRHEAAATQRANIVAQSGIDKTVIGGAINQKQGGGGGSGSAGNIASALTIQYPSTVFEDGQEGKYLIRRQGLPPDVTTAKAVKDMNIEASKYASALHSLRDMINKVSAGGMPPQIFDQEWPAVQSLFEDAIQNNVKFKGNGVANGPDIEHAMKQVGDIASFTDWIRSGGIQKVNTAIGSVTNTLSNIYRDTGFVLSDKPHPNDPYAGIFSGSGGSRPIYDIEQAAKEALLRQGLSPLQRTQKPTSPEPVKPEQGSAKQRLLQKIRGQ